MRPAAFLAILLALLAVAVVQAPWRERFPGPPGLKIWVATDYEKIRPTDLPQPHRTSAVVHAARSETAAFQIIVCADRAPLRNVNLLAGALRHAGGYTIPSDGIRLFREASYPVVRPSHTIPRPGARGDWPDALVPIGSDVYYGEIRNGAPFDVEPGRNQAVWVDIRVPDDAPAGDYRGELFVSSNRGERTISLSLRVWDFTLPPASLPTAFGYDAGIRVQHPGLTPSELERLTLLYAREGLAHRASPWGLWLITGSMPYEYDPEHPDRGVRVTDWGPCDRVYGPLMDGVPEGKATAMDMLPAWRTQTGLTPPGVTARPAPGLFGRLPRGRYLYRVTAVNREGETEGSAPVVALLTSGGAVRLTWKPVKHLRYSRLNPVRYHVYRASGSLRGDEVNTHPAAYLVGSATDTMFVDDGFSPEDPDRPCPEVDSTSYRERLELFKAYAKHFREKGWLDRVYLYSVDEPFSRPELEQGQRESRLWRAAVPGGWSLCTTTYSRPLQGLVNQWCVPYHWFNDRVHAVAGEVKQRQAAGERVWWYHASLTEYPPLQRGGAWPTFAIDDTAMSSRIAGFITWRYGFQGFLYYLTTMAFAEKDNDPWNNQFYFDSNGDGTLLYPGTPDRIGGTHPIPVASLRFRFFRQGMQDYEYLKVLADLGDRAFADAAAKQMVPRTDAFRQDEDWKFVETLRIEIGRRIESRIHAKNTPS